MNRDTADFALFGLYASVLPVLNYLTSIPKKGDRAELQQILYDNLRKIRKDDFPRVIKRKRWEQEVKHTMCMRQVTFQLERLHPLSDRFHLLKSLAKVSVSMPSAFELVERHLILAYPTLESLDLDALNESVKCLTESLEDVKNNFFYGVALAPKSKKPKPT